MKYEKVNDVSLSNKLFHPTRLQKNIIAMHEDPTCRVFKVILAPGEYANVRSAQSSHAGCIRKLGFNNMKARILNGELYIIKLEP